MPLWLIVVLPALVVATIGLALWIAWIVERHPGPTLGRRPPRRSDDDWPDVLHETKGDLRSKPPAPG